LSGGAADDEVARVREAERGGRTRPVGSDWQRMYVRCALVLDATVVPVAPSAGPHFVLSNSVFTPVNSILEHSAYVHEGGRGSRGCRA
jgi:hypothetical protein